MSGLEIATVVIGAVQALYALHESIRSNKLTAKYFGERYHQDLLPLLEQIQQDALDGKLKPLSPAVKFSRKAKVLLEEILAYSEKYKRKSAVGVLIDGVSGYSKEKFAEYERRLDGLVLDYQFATTVDIASRQIEMQAVMKNDRRDNLEIRRVLTVLEEALCEPSELLGPFMEGNSSGRRKISRADDGIKGPTSSSKSTETPRFSNRRRSSSSSSSSSRFSMDGDGTLIDEDPFHLEFVLEPTPVTSSARFQCAPGDCEDAGISFGQMLVTKGDTGSDERGQINRTGMQRRSLPEISSVQASESPPQSFAMNPYASPAASDRRRKSAVLTPTSSPGSVQCRRRTRRASSLSVSELSWNSLVGLIPSADSLPSGISEITTDPSSSSLLSEHTDS